MPQAEDDRKQADKNQSIIDGLRAAFEPIAEHLTPEIEPATMYFPQKFSAKDPE